MTLSMYDASVPLLRQMLGSLDVMLGKAEKHAEDRKIDPEAYLQARLFPDMFALTRQIQIACDFAKGIAARLAGVEVPSVADDQTTFEQLRARIAGTLTFIGSLDAGKFDGAAAREIVLRPGTPKEQRFDGKTYLLNYGLPHFFFHVTTAYALLRHNGVAVGKMDFIGTH